MQISFFEEFPEKRNLDKIKLIDFKTKLYLGCKSLKEFNNIKSSIKNKNVKVVVYWPILEMNEGYWFSPFSKRKALIRIFNELRGKKVPVMIDLELPFTRNKKLFFTQTFNFFRNRKLIREFIENYENIYLCEYFPKGKLKDFIMKFLGLHFDVNNIKIIKMFYSSMHHFNDLEEELKRENEKYDNFIAGFGTIAAGVFGNEPRLSYEQLENDLRTARKAGIKEIVIFRLGGLDKKYVKVLKKYS